MVKRIKTASILFASAIMATLSLTTSCTDYDNGFDEATIRYNQSFIDRYGSIDPNHNWGFGEIGTVDGQMSRAINGGGRTRADGGSDPNQNELIQANNELTTITRKYPKDEVAIPGYPGADGWYHVRFESRGKVHHFKEEEEILKHMRENSISKGNLWPAGDVTDEEILHVSRWFRENKNPGDKIFVDWENFFFQSISMDADREEKDGGCNGKMKVKDARDIWYKDNNNGNDWSVRAKGDVIYNTEHLKAKTRAGVPLDRESMSNTLEGWTDVYNFNQGGYITNFGADEDGENIDCDLNPDEQNRTLHRYIMLFMASGTLDYAWEGTQDHHKYNRWVLVNLDFDIAQNPSEECSIHTGEHCSSHHYNGLYLAFDFELHMIIEEGNNWGFSDCNPDGYYSNWILKLSAANPTVDKIPTEYNKYRRIMCEDLGTTNDFDFNDLVFDVHYTNGEEEGQYTANITVQAAGGTLPIYIGEPQTDGSNEAHHILGQQPDSEGKYTPIINQGTTRTKVDITMDGLDSTDPKDIKLYVANPSNQEAVREITLPDKEGGQYENPGSSVPQKICVPYGTKWTDEHQQIETLYTNFRRWVQDHNNLFWYDNDDETGTGGSTGGSTGGMIGGTGSTNTTDLTWPDGTTHREVEVSVAAFQRLVFIGQDGLALTTTCDSGDETTADVVVNKYAQLIYLYGLKTGEMNLTFTQESTGKTLTLKVTVTGASSGEEMTTKPRPDYSYNIGVTGIDMINDEITVYVEKEFTITVNDKKGQGCTYTFDKGSTNMTYTETTQSNDNDDNDITTTFHFDVGEKKGTATLKISIGEYIEDNTIFESVEKEITIHVIEPDGTKLTSGTPSDDGKKITYSVSDLQELLDDPGTTDLTFTLLFASANYYFGFTADGKNGQSGSASGGTTATITIPKDWFKDIETFYINDDNGSGIIAVYVQSTNGSSAKHRPIRRK